MISSFFFPFFFSFFFFLPSTHLHLLIRFTISHQKFTNNSRPALPTLLSLASFFFFFFKSHQHGESHHLFRIHLFFFSFSSWIILCITVLLISVVVFQISFFVFSVCLSVCLSLPSHSLTLKLVNKLTTNPPHLFLVIFIKNFLMCFFLLLLLLPSSPPLSHSAFLTMYILLIRIPYRIVFFLALGRAITCVHSFMEESLNINREFAYNLALDGTA